MTLRRYTKEREKWDDIKNILESRYNDDPEYIKMAEKDYYSRQNMIRKLKDVSTILSSIAIPDNGNENNKISIFDIKNQKVNLIYPSISPTVLAYSLDSLGYRKLFPMNISSLFNKNINQDIAKNKWIATDLKDLYTFLKNFCYKYNLTVSKIQRDMNTGTLQFETLQTDQIYGPTKQYITIKFDPYSKFEFKDFKGSIKDLASNYKSLFSYFSLFGFSEIYTKCNCKSYLRKYNKKLGIQNYLCSHLLYSMSIFPYYAMTVLSN